MFSFDVQRLLSPLPFPALQLVDGQRLVAIGVNLREHIRDAYHVRRLMLCKHRGWSHRCMLTPANVVDTYLDSVHWLSIVAMQMMESDRTPLVVKEQALNRKATSWSRVQRAERWVGRWTFDPPDGPCVTAPAQATQNLWKPLC